MAAADGRELVRRRGENDTPPLPLATGGGRTLLGMLLGRGLSTVRGWIAPLGRSSLYGGLVLVALPALRLPGEMGSVADVFLLISVVCAFLLLMLDHTLKIGVLKIHAIGVGLVVSGVLIGTIAESTDDLLSLTKLAKFLFATTATIVACMVLLKRRQHVKAALGCWVVSAAITSLVGVLQAGLGDLLVSDQNFWGRAPGLSGNPNGLGAVAGMAIAGGLTLAAISHRVRSVLWLVATLLCVFGVVVAASRAGAIVAVVTLVIWGAMFYRLQREFAVLVVGCCLIGAAVAGIVYVQAWGGQDLSERFASTIDPKAHGNVGGRLDQYEATLEDALKSPLVGVGLADREADVYGIEVHNTFLMLLRAGGLLSLAGIIVVLGDLAWKGFSTYAQRRDSDYGALAAGLLPGIVGLALDGMAGPVLFQREVWIPAALLVAVIVRADRSREARAVARPRGIPRSGRMRQRHRENESRRSRGRRRHAAH